MTGFIAIIPATNAVTTVLATTLAITPATISVWGSLGVTVTTAIKSIGRRSTVWVIISFNAVTVVATYIATVPILLALLTAFSTASYTTTDIKSSIHSVIAKWIR